jgi:hypothetical protein
MRLTSRDDVVGSVPDIPCRADNLTPEEMTVSDTLREDKADKQSNVDQLIVGTSEQGGSIGRTGLNKSGAIRCHSRHSVRQSSITAP